MGISRAPSRFHRVFRMFSSRARTASADSTLDYVDWGDDDSRSDALSGDSPNDRVERALRRVECSMATTRSGHDASSVHYLAPCVARTSSRRESGRAATSKDEEKEKMNRQFYFDADSPYLAAVSASAMYRPARLDASTSYAPTRARALGHLHRRVHVRLGDAATEQSLHV